MSSNDLNNQSPKKDSPSQESKEKEIPPEINTKNNLNQNITNNNNKNNNPEQNDEEEEMNQSNSSMELNITTYEIKIVFLGDSDVGKTSIIKRFCTNKFDEIGPISTISVAYSNKTLKVDPFTEVNMKIWDTAGQEKYRAMTRGYIRGAQGIFLVFDLSKKKSFEALNSWLDEIKGADIDNNCVKILIGNKSDFIKKEVDETSANKFAEENNMKYLAVSAKDGVNIESMFEIMGGSCAKIIQELPDNEKYYKQPEVNETDKKFYRITDIDSKKSKKKKIKRNPSCC